MGDAVDALSVRASCESRVWRGSSALKFACLDCAAIIRLGDAVDLAIVCSLDR